MFKYTFLQHLVFAITFPWIAWLGHTANNIKLTMICLVIGVSISGVISFIVYKKQQKKEQKELQELIERSKRECEEKIKEFEEARAKLNVANP